MATKYLDYENGDDANDGSTWALAWKTITSGATGARIAPGDVIRIAKSPDPTSLGIAAQWTDESKTVELASALTANIALCEGAWTAADGNVTCSTSTTRKQGSYSASIQELTAKGAGKLAYLDLGSSLDFSGYQQISLWLRSNATIGGSIFRLDLCSDATGDTPVNQLTITDPLYISTWNPLVLNNGSALGSSIRSISLWQVSDPGPLTLYLDDIIACKAPGNDALTLASLIGKNAAGETWYAIQSINGTTVLLDNSPDCGAAAGRGYSGTTESVTTYKRETIRKRATVKTTPQEGVQDSGNHDSHITFSGGWNTSSSLQDGMTCYDGVNGWGTGIYMADRSGIDLDHLLFVRYYRGISAIRCYESNLSDLGVTSCGEIGTPGIDNISLESCTGFHCARILSVNSGDSGCNFTLSSSAATGSSDHYFEDCQFRNNLDDGIDPTMTPGVVAKNCTFKNNATVSVDLDGNSTVDCYNCLFDTSYANFPTTMREDGYFRSSCHNQTAGRFLTVDCHSGVGSAGVASDQITAGYAASWAYGGSGLCLVLNPSQTVAGRELRYGKTVRELGVKVTGGTLYKLAFMVKKSSAASTCTLKVSVFDSDDDCTKLVDQVTVTLTDAWAQFLSASFTPTVTGACRILLEALDGATTGDIGVDNIRKVAA